MFTVLLVFVLLCSPMTAQATQLADDGIAGAQSAVASNGLQLSPAAKQANLIQTQLSTVSGYNSKYTALFRDAYICGDSIIQPIVHFNYVSSANVSAKVGATLSFLAEQVPTIIKADPKFIILHFGLNCLNSSVTKRNEFIAEYERLVKLIKNELPCTTVFISALFPVAASSQSNVPFYAQRDVYNRALRTMCDKNGWCYINSDPLVVDYIKSLSSDGIHLFGMFYSNYWLKYLLIETGLADVSCPGDIDKSGAVTATDARLALRNSVHLEHITMGQKLNADTDFNNVVDAADARSILRIAVALEKPQTTESTFLQNLNSIRQFNGQKPLQYNSELSELATGRAIDMQRTGKYTHNTTLYGTVAEGLNARGFSYSTAAECIIRNSNNDWAYVNGSAETFSAFTEIGIGLSPDGKTTVLLFAD